MKSSTWKKCRARQRTCVHTSRSLSAPKVYPSSGWRLSHHHNNRPLQVNRWIQINFITKLIASSEDRIILCKWQLLWTGQWSCSVEMRKRQSSGRKFSSSALSSSRQTSAGDSTAAVATFPNWIHMSSYTHDPTVPVYCCSAVTQTALWDPPTTHRVTHWAVKWAARRRWRTNLAGRAVKEALSTLKNSVCRLVARIVCCPVSFKSLSSLLSTTNNLHLCLELFGWNELN